MFLPTRSLNLLHLPIQVPPAPPTPPARYPDHRSEEHTSELQSREKLVCRLLLEKKKRRRTPITSIIPASSFCQRLAPPSPFRRMNTPTPPSCPYASVASSSSTTSY